MSTSNMRFLVPVDFSKQSEITLQQAYNLASFYNAELLVLHIHQDFSKMAKKFAEIDEAGWKAELENKLDALTNAVDKDENVKITILLKEGGVTDQILATIEQEKVTMVVMPTLEKQGLKKRFIASNTIRVVKRASCPVITIKGSKHRPGCENIVLPLDLSKTTTHKVKSAISVAKMFGASIWVVSVVMTGEEKIVEKLEGQIREVQNQILKEGIECRAEFVRIVKGEQSLATAIIDYAEKVEADLLIIMTQQESDTTDFFIGSSAQGVINHSDIPVLSVHPK